MEESASVLIQTVGRIYFLCWLYLSGDAPSSHRRPSDLCHMAPLSSKLVAQNLPGAESLSYFQSLSMSVMAVCYDSLI